MLHSPSIIQPNKYQLLDIEIIRSKFNKSVNKIKLILAKNIKYRET